MKICIECKKEVSNAKWSHKNNMCSSCVARNKYRDEHPELKELLTELKKKTKNKLIHTILAYKGNRANINLLFAQKNWQIKHFRTRILKIRNQLDYLLKHPYSSDSSMQTRPHKRDGMNLAHKQGVINQYRRNKNERTKYKRYEDK